MKAERASVLDFGPTQYPQQWTNSGSGRKYANYTTGSLDGISDTCSVDRAFSAALARLRKAQARLLRRHRVRKNILPPRVPV